MHQRELDKGRWGNVSHPNKGERSLEGRLRVEPSENGITQRPEFTQVTDAGILTQIENTQENDAGNREKLKTTLTRIRKLWAKPVSPTAGEIRMNTLSLEMMKMKMRNITAGEAGGEPVW